ncbi:MAG: class I SAM-dependent methyltransferase [Candidatus Aureabacteria bacterium]|nr:class I SAM-dependent methyltransferase [Candidatus Auribacterota bacterium]
MNPATFSRIASCKEIWNEILSFYADLASDEYIKYLETYYRESLKRFGNHWWYFDIVNVLYTASKLLQPKNYLEIGVRRGRSVCTVAKACPSVDIYAFDLWVKNYADMDNPGPHLVEQELKKVSHSGKIQFYNGDSHETIPEFFSKNPSLSFDLITVDGDHSKDGAWKDLQNVIPRLSLGGIIVFDDISHPSHPYLLSVWKQALGDFPFLTGFEYTDLGYGVAYAIRKSN